MKRLVEIAEIKGIIKLLEQHDRETDKKIDKLVLQCDDLADIKNSISIVSLTLQHVAENNSKQDIIMTNLTDTLSSINANLSELNQGQSRNSEQIGTLKKRVDLNEQLHSIDLREAEQARYISSIVKYGVPAAGVGGALALIIAEIIKMLQN